jgi:TetR/AcrR family transcriptional regulator
VAASFRRARKPAEKAQRRAAILRAAAELVEEEGLEDVGLNAIARRSGVSKPNVYRYFESHEEVLLRLFLEDLGGFVGEAERGLAPLAGTGDHTAVAGALTEAFVARPRPCRLLGVLQSVLEQNVSGEVIAEAKAEALELSQRSARALHAALPGAPLEGCGWANSTIALLVAGMWPAAHPAPNAALVLDREEFRVLKPDMERDLKKAILVLLRGLGEETVEPRAAAR